MELGKLRLKCPQQRGNRSRPAKKVIASHANLEVCTCKHGKRGDLLMHLIPSYTKSVLVKCVVRATAWKVLDLPDLIGS